MPVSMLLLGLYPPRVIALLCHSGAAETTRAVGDSYGVSLNIGISQATASFLARIRWTAYFASLLLAGCGSATEPAPTPAQPVLAISARLTGQVSLEGQVYSGLDVTDCLTEHLMGPAFAEVLAQVIEQAPTTGHSVGWQFHLGIADPSSVQLNVAGAMYDGLNLPLYAGIPEVGWGRKSIISPVVTTGAVARLWVGDYRSEQGTGLLRVLKASPLEVDADVLFRDPGGRQARFVGRISFTPYLRVPSCSN